MAGRPRQPDTGTAAVSVEGLVKRYGGHLAVAGVSFTVGEGELFALLGPNGAGKTTTIRSLLGLVAPNHGRVAVFGHEDPAAVSDQVGYLPEERGLYIDERVIDNLVYLATLRGVSARTARHVAMDDLERVGLAEYAGKRVKTLSRGMQQKVQFLSTIVHRPRLLVIDEPFSGLDPVNTRQLSDLLLQLHAAGTTIILSTHQMSRVEELCRRLVMLQHGRVVLSGTVADVRHRFSAGIVLVEAAELPAELPGVIDRHTHGGVTALQLAPGVDPDLVLSGIVSGGAVDVRRFEVHLPSLDDIFVAVAGGTDTVPSIGYGGRPTAPST